MKLKSGAVFSRADYFSLVDAASKTLSTDLVAQDEMLIQPGQQLTLERTLDEQSRLLGLVVSYRELDRAVWCPRCANQRRGLYGVGRHVRICARACNYIPTATD